MGPRKNAFSSSMIEMMPVDAIISALPQKMIINCDIKQHSALDLQSESGKVSAVKLIRDAQPESNAGCLTMSCPVLLKHADRFYTVTAFQFMLTHFRQIMVVSEVAHAT